MSDLKISATILVSYVILVLGIANIDEFQDTVINFSPVFFILIAGAVFTELLISGMLIQSGVRVSNYAFAAFWGVVYLLLWYFYWRGESALPIQVHAIQIVLLEVASVLAYNMGRQIGQVDKMLEGLAANAYPNRTRNIQEAQSLINDELSRSRRYHHPLSVLVLRLEDLKGKRAWENNERLERDMIERFASAKIGQIVSELSRGNDLILRDRDGQFVILCPETDHGNASRLAARILSAVDESLEARITCGIASFPDEALDFKDLLNTAKQRLLPGVLMNREKAPDTLSGMDR